MAASLVGSVTRANPPLLGSWTTLPFTWGCSASPSNPFAQQMTNQSSLVQGDSWRHNLAQHGNMILWRIHHWIVRHASFNLFILQLTAQNFSRRIWEYPPLAMISTFYSYYSPWGILWHHSFTKYVYCKQEEFLNKWCYYQKITFNWQGLRLQYRHVDVHLSPS
jgi:hypothetical protein